MCIDSNATTRTAKFLGSADVLLCRSWRRYITHTHAQKKTLGKSLGRSYRGERAHTIRNALQLARRSKFPFRNRHFSMSFPSTPPHVTRYIFYVLSLTSITELRQKTNATQKFANQAKKIAQRQTYGESKWRLSTCIAPTGFQSRHKTRAAKHTESSLANKTVRVRSKNQKLEPMENKARCYVCAKNAHRKQQKCRNRNQRNKIKTLCHTHAHTKNTKQAVILCPVAQNESERIKFLTGVQLSYCITGRTHRHTV